MKSKQPPPTPTRLKPSESAEPLQSGSAGAVLPATIVLWNLGLPPRNAALSTKTPPALWPAALAAIVVFDTSPATSAKT